MNPQELVMRRENAKVFLVNDEWPEEITASLKFLADADRDFLNIGRSSIEFLLTDRRARYRISHWDEKAGGLFCVLIVDSVEGG